MAQAVSFSSDNVGDFTQVITLDGQCDGSTAVEAQAGIRAALASGRTQLVFDLRGVSSVAPSMLQMLSRGAIEAKTRHGGLAIIRPNEHVWAMFEQGGLGRVFPTFQELKGALARA